MKSFLLATLFQIMLSALAKDLTSCGDPCIGGACLFTNCQATSSCKGGACKFINCLEPICEGGACLFDACKEPKCPGGGCDFFNTVETLKPGYCNGEACKLDGKPHPSMREGHVSL